VPSNDRQCTPVTPSAVHGKEGVVGSSPTPGFTYLHIETEVMAERTRGRTTRSAWPPDFPEVARGMDAVPRISQNRRRSGSA
jgi:hypothetical protein